ncbi:MAG: AraC family transcriptional regulator [Eubacteriales bacterium]|nr:AraC family transcriptional regulator [Eubacteriales bacterium]
MSRFFVGREVRKLTDNHEISGIQVWHLNLKEKELGHMACRIEDTMQFIYICRGNMVCQLNQDRTRLRSGEGLFINRRTAYRFLDGGKGSCEFFLISVEADYIGDGEEGIITGKYVRPLMECVDFSSLKLERRAENQDAILEYVKRAGNIADSGSMCCELELKSLMFQVWSKLYAEFSSLSPSCKKSVLHEAEKLVNMLEFLHEHYRDKITLGEMAENSGVSSGEYCRFFKKRMNQTPFEYLQAYRIEQSLPELLEKSGSITQIALRHGFTGSSYYAETFKKEMGCAPGDYRKWCLGELDVDCPLKLKGADESASQKQPVKRQESMPAHLL